MDILFIIYIFALFVIFSPNFIFKYSQSNNIYISLTHALIFSVVIYITYNSVVKSETEGATIGSFNKNNEYYPLRLDEMNLGTINAETPTIEKNQDVTYNNDIIVSTPNTAEEQRLTAMPAYDYSNFKTYDYENMKKKVDMLETHEHTNHYFDLVPNFNETKHEILCASDYGTNKPCCRQPNADIPEINQCTALKPYCQDYISGVQWGKCVSTNPYPKPNLVYDGAKNKDLVVSPTGETKPTVVVEKEYITKYINNCPAPAPAPAVVTAPGTTKVTISGTGTLTKDIVNDKINETSDINFSTPITVVIEGFKEIGATAFQFSQNLVQVTIPNTVTTIGVRVQNNSGYGAFQQCYKLNKVIFEENSQLTFIGVSTFRNCKVLKEITIPPTVTYIGQSAFGITGLTSITIPPSVSTLMTFAVANCPDLETVTFEGNSAVTSVNSQWFQSSTNLKTIYATSATLNKWNITPGKNNTSFILYGPDDGVTIAVKEKNAEEPVISETVNINVYKSPWKQPMISSIEIYQQPTNSHSASLTKEGDTVVYTYTSNMIGKTDMFILKNSSNNKLIKYNVSIQKNLSKKIHKKIKKIFN